MLAIFTSALIEEDDLTKFSLEFLQALNDWQKGGDSVKKGGRLKTLIVKLDAKFRSCDVVCYRQEAHEKDRLWQLIADNKLPERIASWTTDLEVAKSFKGGVPPQGLQGVVFKLLPPTGSVVLNVAALYQDPCFLTAIERHKDHVIEWHDGIGRYGDKQAEVILELDSLSSAEVARLGGFVGTYEQLARERFGREPTDQEIAHTQRDIEDKKIQPAQPWWLGEAGTQAALARVEPQLDSLRKKKRARKKQALNA